MNLISFKPIGIIRTQYIEKEKVPKQAALAEKSMLSAVILDETYLAELAGLEEYSHIILIYQFHKHQKYIKEHAAKVGNNKAGTFATRDANRPNPIGLSIVRLLKIEENRIYFYNADMFDETPVLDIKPFIPVYDHRDDASGSNVNY